MADSSRKAQIVKLTAKIADEQERLDQLLRDEADHNQKVQDDLAMKIGKDTIKLLGRDATEQDRKVHIAILRELENDNHYYTERMNNPEEYGLLSSKAKKNKADSEQFEMQMEVQTANNSEEMPF